MGYPSDMKAKRANTAMMTILYAMRRAPDFRPLVAAAIEMRARPLLATGWRLDYWVSGLEEQLSHPQGNRVGGGHPDGTVWASRRRRPFGGWVNWR